MRTTLISSRDENKGKKKIEEGYVRVAGACDNHPTVLAFSYTLSFMYYQHFFLLILHVQMFPPPPSFFLQGIFFLFRGSGRLYFIILWCYCCCHVLRLLVLFPLVCRPPLTHTQYS